MNEILIIHNNDDIYKNSFEKLTEDLFKTYGKIFDSNGRIEILMKYLKIGINEKIILSMFTREEINEAIEMLNNLEIIK